VRGNTPIGIDFFRQDPVICAKGLIGCTLGFRDTSGVIVETEAYDAQGDPACHTWRRPSAREFVSINRAGTAYVYLNYGMHWMLNFLVKGKREGFVLIRAIQPLGGLELMQGRRIGRTLNQLCNGPAKLTQAMGINGAQHGVDPLRDSKWVLRFPSVAPDIAVSTRIGITVAADYPWRFLMKGSSFVSRPQ